MTRRSLLPVAAALSFLAGARGAGAQSSHDVILHANLDEHAGYSDVWGYTAPGGGEYALLATWTGLSVVNVSDPSAPYETGFLPGPHSTWRDVKTFGDRAYVTNESGGGMAIVDLSDPENPALLPPYGGFLRAHNLFVDEAQARCYVAGSDLGTGGIRILSLADPDQPVEIGSWEVQYAHDVVTSGNVLFASAIFARELFLLDVTDPSAIPPALAVIANYPSAFTHNAWPVPGGGFVMTTDEVTGASCRMWDLTDLAQVVESDSYRPVPSASPHNAHIDGDLAYISHYTAGVRIVDVSDPYDLQEVAAHDTYPQDDGGTFNGCWGVFPFFQTTPGLFVASDIQSGLFVMEYRGPLGTVAGRVTRAGSPGTGVAGAGVRVVETGVRVNTDQAGDYLLLDTAGAVTVEVDAFGYDVRQLPVTITAGQTQSLDVSLTLLPSGTVSGEVLDSQTALPVPGALVTVLGTPLSEVADGAGAYTHAAIPSGTHTLRAFAFGFDRLEAEIGTHGGSFLTLDFPLSPATLSDDFESADPAWTVSGNAVTGQWERADPEPTSEGGQVVQPGNDHTPAGTLAWVTGAAAGQALGHHDVDGGSTVLTTPLMDVSQVVEPRVSFWRWYSTGQGNPTVDTWTVEVSSDAGSSWILLESLTQPVARWSLVDMALDSLVTATPQVVFRFTARDTGAGSITEAAIDDFSVYGTGTMTGTAAPFAGPLPAELRLSHGYPNPARAGEVVRLALALPARSLVEAAVFDVTGRRVAGLASDVLPAGGHRLEWDGRAGGRPAAPGVYFVRLVTESGARSRKLVLVR